MITEKKEEYIYTLSTIIKATYIHHRYKEGYEVGGEALDP